MDTTARLAALRDAMQRDLRENILPFWTRRVVDERAGFHGLVSEDGTVDAAAPKGGVLAARLVWTFSAAYSRLGDESLGRTAEQLFSWVAAHLFDEQHGGSYWMLDQAGRPLSDRKQTYALAFTIYALAELSLATGSSEALERAIALYRAIEEHAADLVHGGYFEARARDWSPLQDVRLSERDLNAPKSMNTHLHVMEAYTNLLRVWDAPELRRRLRALVQLHLDRIVDPESAHLRLFFDERFTPVSRGISYGHDIEASWLLLEAARETADAALVERADREALRLARVTLAEGFDPEHGGVFAERREDGSLDDEKHWWMQAEAIVGFLNAFELSADPAFLAAAERTWAFVERCLIDREHGEWRWRTKRDGSRIPGLPKVEPWKCPYHNSRAALETLERVERLLGSP